MGTRSLTWVYDTYTQKNGKEKHTPIIKLYRQYDGYMEGHGLELAEFLSPIAIVNGLGAKTEKVANGMGCLAAQLVAHFKDGPGQFYLYPPKPGVDNWQEYEYHVYKNKVEVVTVGTNNDNVIFSGTWAEFKDKCEAKRNQYNKDFA